MASTRAIPVRLSDEVLQRLEAAARRMHMGNRTDVIKFCLTTFLDHFEKEGLEWLPVDWRSVVRDLDGRAHRYDNRMVSESPPAYGRKVKRRKNGTAKEGKP